MHSVSGGALRDFLPFVFEDRPTSEIYSTTVHEAVATDNNFVESIQETTLTGTSKEYWHPTVEMHQYTTRNLALTGPLSPKITTTKSIKTHQYNNLHFKWGG